MKKLILHIEWGDGIQLNSDELEGYLDSHLGNLFGNLEHQDPDSPDAGWRWFPDLDSALDWEMGLRTSALSKDAQEWLEVIKECDGAEVPRGDWETVKELVTAGLVSLGSARGPGRDWRRAELADG
ncbi:hypothetical protein LCGC14_1424410 [marine sediment metagenome]|uniref:Uncharacterized protein n=1 Tax=marine sediment metagenome TaxID=412755 RepID=A0A0F9M5V0_9ZZZZ